jgi:hypothetical protein
VCVCVCVCVRARARVCVYVCMIQNTGTNKESIIVVMATNTLYSVLEKEVHISNGTHTV